MKKIKIADRVANGMRWLDENFPGWEGRIKINTLALDDEYRCICGQVFRNKASGHVSGYMYAHNNLFAEANSWISAIVPKGDGHAARSTDVAYVLGFLDAPYGETEVESHYGGLQREWRRRLKERAKA